MQAALRCGDIIGRLAGDELCVVANSLPSRQAAIEVTERLMAAAGKPWTTPDGLSVVVSVSAGICLYPEHAQTAEDLLQGAHAAVYGAKSRGSNAWCFFHEDMTQAARERLELEARLRRALDQGHMRLYYQPQIDLQTGRLMGAEALLRWLDPEEGLISPARFKLGRHRPAGLVGAGRGLPSGSAMAHCGPARSDDCRECLVAPVSAHGSGGRDEPGAGGILLSGGVPGA